MKTTKQWLDNVQRLNGLRTHAELAKALKISQPHLSRLTKEYSYLSDDTAENVAILCGVPLAVVLTDIQIERATSEPQRNAWTMISAAMNAMLNTTSKGATAAATAIALVMGMTALPLESRANTTPQPKNLVECLYYVNSRRKRPAQSRLNFMPV
jgi:transcriptional regulator with XRE-family HTH domain